jgi:acyl carrier protein
MSDKLETRIKQMIVERCFLDIDPEEIDDDDALMEAVGLDSVQLLEVVVGLEEVFGLTFEDTDFDIENFSSVSAIAEHVREKTAQAG